MGNIGGRVREAVASVLQDPMRGLNINLAVQAAALGLDLESDDQLNFSWNPADGQFYRSNISFDDLISTGDPVFPLCCLYCLSSEDTRERTYKEFSGTARIGIAFYLSITQGNAFTRAELYQDAIENACMQTLHENEAMSTMAGAGVISLRDTVFERLEIIQAGENWLIPSIGTMTFAVDQ